MEITYDKIKAWKDAKAKLKHWKAEEALLRLEICAEIIGGDVGHFSRKQVVGDEELKASAVLNMNVDEAMLSYLNGCEKLTPDELECFKRPLKIVEGKLRKLPRDSSVWKAITETPGMSQLEVKDV